MAISDVITPILYLGGMFFFVAGTLGYLRFPDLYSKMHAATKADNVGMALILLGAGIDLGDLSVALKLLLIWIAVLFGAGISSNLLSNMGQRQGVAPDVVERMSAEETDAEREAHAH